MPAGFPFRTSYPFPFALVQRGGGTPGKRLPTRVAFITEAIARNGKIVAYKGYIAGVGMTTWTQTERDIPVDDVIHSWRQKPSARSIQQAQKRVPILAAENER